MRRLATTMRALIPRSTARGFTLVELMIAMALVGLLTAVIYALFVSTADSLTDVEGHSEALDQGRFGIEQVRLGLLAAGSQATPNSQVDPWMVSNERHGANQPDIFAIIQHDDWQEQSIEDIEDQWLDGGDDRRLASDGDNPHSAFSSFVVLGAFDVPANLFVSFPSDDGIPDIDTNNPEFVIEGTERGLHRVLGYDPFDTRVVNEVNAPADLDDRAQQRLLRVSDREGFSQIQPITAATVGSSEALGGAGGQSDSGDSMVTGDAMSVTLPDLHFRSAGEPAGFDVSVEDDVSFDAALIDAYWYHVRPAPDDPQNLQLVRQRLDASEMVDQDNLDDLDEASLEDYRVDPPMILAEGVVDFRVWFDCKDSVGQDVIDADWENEWQIDDYGDCIADGNPHLAQVAHARLATRTASENPNRPHYTVVDGWPGFESDNGQMRTFELVPGAEGSAAVVTTQTSVELTNFSIRDYRD